MPNILFITTDQQRFDTLGVNGSAVCKTPHIDSLAASGMNFSRAYTPIPLCSPARMSLLTGLYPHNHGGLSNPDLFRAQNYNLSPSAPTFVGPLRQAGYRLGYVGKWHVSTRHTPLDFGFDDYVSLEAYNRFRAESGYAPATAPPNRFQINHGTDPAPISHSGPRFFANSAVRLLEQYAAAGRPFFLRLDFVEPHHPCVVPEPFASMYDPADIPKWPAFDDPLQNKPFMQTRLRQIWNTVGMTWKECASFLALYWGSVSQIDHEVGRVLAACARLGIADETVVIFTSDHGDMCGNHRLFEKAYLAYEDVVHVPLVIRYPQVTSPGSVCDLPVHHFLDLMPTFLEVTGLPAPKGIDGRSLLPLLRGTSPTDWPVDIFTEYHGQQFGLYSQRMLKVGRYKYVLNLSDISELYDLEEDPAELHNLIDDPAMRPTLRHLQALLLERMSNTNDPLVNPWVGGWLRREIAMG